MIIANRQIVILEIIKELLWWMISALIALAAMYPLLSKLYYNLAWINGVLLTIALSYFRYATYLSTVFVLRSRWVRAALCIFNINFFVFVLRKQQYFMSIYDSFTIDDMGIPRKPLILDQVNELFNYFFGEITFAVVACLTLTFALTVRIVLAYWKTAHQRLNAGDEE